ncbi:MULTISPECIES: mechanosensitive ion channel domain-containing protein [unclassified Sphingopyxis]|uniref:mechanosensitive ion channel family protein n=1 Tax=unclassified Sphingopyxis TaxID=2614943 RepID=UPI002855C76A|nr:MULTISPECIES: mechanosensitive ion channel domain-containing protein [unclassified Sphingopyxis]MDR7058446.1 small-conductance mechanosensitive channel [Sphingopyxis sp. BE235]MDR7179368.1 small-conductance mechanosensitive channel [Sphingopyxis sp. BE249]
MDGLSGGLLRTIEALKAIGIDVGSYRLSLYGLFSTIVVAVLLYLAVRIILRSIKWLLRRNTQIDATQQLLAEKLIAIALFVFALLFGIDLLGIDLTALAVFSGAAGLAIGFGLQKTVGNLIAGIILLMDRSIKPGDIIVVGDGSSMGGSALPGGVPNVGRVAKIGVRAVNVVTRDGKKHLIPNELLMTQAVENWSYASPEVRVRMRVPVGYGCDLRLAQRLIMETATANPRILNEPEPAVWITAFGERAVEHELRYWISDPEAGLGNIQGEVFLGIWDRFKEAGIAIPYPRQDVRIIGAPDDSPAPTSKI